MIKCTGICSKCGRCSHAALINEDNNRKTKLFVYPDDFSADTNKGIGVAFDIGTTTVVGMLWDLEKGQMIDTCAATNPQNKYGMDVISRITYCGKNTDRHKELRNKILECLNNLIKKLCKNAKRSIYEIKKITICGNTIMSHIAAGFSSESLAVAPFTPAYTGTLNMKALNIDLDLNPMTDVTFLPNIAGHVGGDITAGVLASRVMDQEGLTFFIDIGTNGEMILADGKNMYACSTAAGPAFEGASIKCGMRAADGAIEKVWIDNGNVFFKTIGESAAKGICGSGLIDIIAQMLDAGLINKKGRLISADDAEEKGLPNEITERIIEVNGKREFIILKNKNGNDIVITQNDIREVQLAKGAVAAGIKIMLDKTGNSIDTINKVMVAGAFGSYIDKKNAVRIGLLPPVDTDKIISVGNAAGTGVSMALVSEAELEYAEALPEKIHHIDLAAEESFQSIFIKAMSFK